MVWQTRIQDFKIWTNGKTVAFHALLMFVPVSTIDKVSCFMICDSIEGHAAPNCFYDLQRYCYTEPVKGSIA